MSEPTVTIRFFARLREELETEQLSVPAVANQTVSGLLASLASRGGPWARLTGDQPVMVAVNQAMAKPSTPVRAGDEVAFFPPVTGG
ncbi:molybdopterin converting factor subunit 1 [Marinobacter daepoensis]|uniref:Molybdopterin synthase sulfur carrier subunit n=1 Tax=Marinobacter daepoensis TaxID=262077 RepID=A0ABS3B9N0_9GAMM|nr:molybdopterin converting factor subunit 1 [Marinobacter daepoensis]MBN7768571.1 molybdopterin converting factor subunit 1 [Marinobacter daepoensis]MBY6032975.1 molybdopterin converting factor subunit 1 [Marinobacter daepoensis]MBY6079308.1 molybdopterin converting factor subunit 1 [Marinobacter daepoensis]